MQCKTHTHPHPQKTCPPFTHKHNCKASSISVSFLLSFSLLSSLFFASPLHTSAFRHAFQVCRKGSFSLCRGRRQSTLFWSFFSSSSSSLLFSSAFASALRTVFENNQYPHRHSQQFRYTLHTHYTDLSWAYYYIGPHNTDTDTFLFASSPADLMAKHFFSFLLAH